jgi:hypothetical protein
MEKKKVIIGVVLGASLLLAAATASAQQQKVITNTYAAKFICGVQRDNGITDVPDAQPGRYSSKINVHNNTGVLITYRKKFIRLVGGELGEKAMDPGTKVFEQLNEDQGMEVVCKDIYKQLPLQLNNQLPPPFVEGFVIFEVYFLSPSHGGPPPPDPLDVEGIYTYKGDLPGSANASGVSIDVVVYPAKSNSHAMH